MLSSFQNELLIFSITMYDGHVQPEDLTILQHCISWSNKLSLTLSCLNHRQVPSCWSVNVSRHTNAQTWCMLNSASVAE